MKPLELKSCIAGASVAAIVGIAVAIFFTVADWRLNPGGIFQGESGTHWGVVLETAISWFLPVTVLVFVLVTAVHYWLAPRVTHE